MPVAAQIAVLPAYASSAMTGAAGSRGKAVVPDAGVAADSGAGPGSVSGRDFSKLFREQAGTMDSAMAGVKSAAGEDALSPQPKAQEETDVSPAEGDVPEGEQVTTGTGKEASGVATATLPDSPQAALRAQLQSELQGQLTDSGAEAVIGAASAGVGKDKPGSLSAAEPVNKAEHKTKQATDRIEAKPAAASAASTEIAAMPLAVTPAAASVAGATKTQPPGVAANTNNVVPAASSAFSQSASAKDRPEMQPVEAQTAGEDQDASSSIAANTAGNSLQSATSKDANGEVAPNAAGNDVVADSKISGTAAKIPGDAASALQHNSSAGHAAATSPAAVVAMPAHSADGGVSSATVARVEQSPGIGAAAPGTGSAPVAAASAYDRIDQGAAPVLLHSGMQHVAVGVQDPNLGWVEIKTQNLAGHVDAMLITASGQTHDALAAQLPAMAQFLEQRDVRVGTLAVHQEMPGGQNNFAGAGNGTGNGAGHSGGGAQHSGNSGGGADSRPLYAGLSPGPSRTASASGAAAADDAAYRPVSYISVRA